MSSYFVKQGDQGYCVMQQGPDDAATVRCFPTQQEAEDHLQMCEDGVFPDGDDNGAATASQSGSSDSPGPRADAASMSTLQALHDRLLADRPAGAAHDEGTCPFCAAQQGGEDAMSERTFTEADVQAAVERAVAEATGPLQARLAELESNEHQSAMERAVADAKAEAEATISELQAKLDAAVLEAAQAKEAKEAAEATRAAEKQAEEDAKELAARKDQRLAAVREVAAFPETYLLDNADRFASLSDEEFAARLEEWRTIAGKEGGVPSTTSLKAAREETQSDGSLLAELGNFRRSLVHPRSV